MSNYCEIEISAASGVGEIFEYNAHKKFCPTQPKTAKFLEALSKVWL